MNMLVKTAIAGALTVGATSAFGMGIVSSNSSDLILYVDAISNVSTGASAGTYAYDTGISISSLLPQSSLTANASNVALPGVATHTVTGITGLSAFLSANSSSTIEWELEGGNFNGATPPATGTTVTAKNSNTTAQGAALAVFTSPALTSLYPGVANASTGNLQSFLNGLNGDEATGGPLAGLQTSNNTTGSETLGAQDKYGFFSGADLGVTGTAQKLFGFTGGGVLGGQLEVYALGSATLNADGSLAFTSGTSTTPPPPVPLPAAVWLFGSGLMGLVGVSRRRKAAAAV